MVILDGNSAEFKKYGKIIDNVDFSSLVAKLGEVKIPDSGVAYEPSVELLESADCYKDIKKTFYGELPIEIGYCAGHNSLLNAVEYHRSSEINVFATDAILILGLQQDIEDGFKYDSSKMVAFKFKKGQATEVYATTLHYAPCGVDGNGFMVGVVLPYGTNFPLEGEHKAGGEDQLITAQNKWLIAHPDAAGEAGHFMGIYGKNLDINE
ncbi:MAG: DUF4867 family protein [Clostridiales bacterium]|nr:DUF4867 family protein [Clostridiales bacterium]